MHISIYIYIGLFEKIKTEKYIKHEEEENVIQNINLRKKKNTKIKVFLRNGKIKINKRLKSILIIWLGFSIVRTISNNIIEFFCKFVNIIWRYCTNINPTITHYIDVMLLN